MNKLRAILIGMFFALLLLATARPASAAPLRHPLGNFTVNQYSALTVQGDGIAIHYVLDEAEIPTYQELGEIRDDHSSDLTPAQHDALLKSKTATLISNLQLEIGGAAVKLEQRSAALSFPAGAGGLSTMRVEMQLFAAISGASKGQLVYHDNNFPDRIGWKEIIANPGQGGTVEQSDVAATDRSNALTAYPSDMLNSPPQIHSATVSFTTNGVAVSGSSGAAPQPVTQANNPADWITGRVDALTQVMTQGELTFTGFLIALLIAFVLGGAHALSPGHGKTVAAAYLVGSRGTPVHALLLGLSVTITHTIGVFILGLITMFAASYVLPEQLFPWITFASGLILIIMGVGLFASRLGTLRASGHTLIPRLPLFARPALEPALAVAGKGESQYHSHEHGEDHVHGHGPGQHTHGPGDDMHKDYPWSKPHSHTAGLHSHDEMGEGMHKDFPWSKPHSHAPRKEASVGSLIALGASGGLLPCPSALIVMLSAISFNRIGLGIVLIIAFSLGLAAVLTGIGLLFLYARKLVERAPLNNVWLQRLPVVSAIAVAFLGLAIAFEALTSAKIFG